MTRAAIRLVLCGAFVALTAAVSLAQTSSTTETKKFQVIAVEGNQLVVKLPEGTRELTVPEDFRFNVADKMLSVHDRTVREALAANKGREVKHTGDGIMASFQSAAAAVRCACQVQAGLGEYNAGEPLCPVIVRIGITAGEPVEQSDDLFGSTVQLAARLCAQADPGQVLVSSVVADLCIGKGLKFSSAGECQLKGFNEPILTHAVELVC